MPNTATARGVVATLFLLAATSLEIAYADDTIEERITVQGAGTSGTSQLIRLDEDKIYTLDVGKKEYTEISLAEKRRHRARCRD